jgi:hypothetical protein
MCVAWGFVPLAVTTTLSERPVSYNPCRDSTNVFDAPESNIACVMACSIALASRCIAAFIAFRHSRRRAQRSADLDVGLGPALTTKRDGSSWGGGSSPVVAR